MGDSEQNSKNRFAKKKNLNGDEPLMNLRTNMLNRKEEGKETEGDSPLPVD